jgi:hypothetical protein
MNLKAFWKRPDALGFLSGRVQADLERFCRFTDERGRETGGWRGQVGESETAYPSSMSARGTRAGFRQDIEGQRYRTEAEVTKEKSSPGQQRADEIAAEVPFVRRRSESWKENRRRWRSKVAQKDQHGTGQRTGRVKMQ